MQGKIIKGIAGFYYIHTKNNGIYECRAKGIFRNQKIKPLIGDNVEIDILDEATKVGNLISILERKNQLIRPAVSNIDQALVIFASAMPTPNLNLLDRFLVMMLRQGIETIICFHKTDIVSKEEIERLRTIYMNCGYTVIFTSTLVENGVDCIRELIRNKTTVMAGPSGVGKSSILNLIQPKAHMETGPISAKIKRGKHTTRHSELFYAEDQAYLMDTPGFSSLTLEDLEKEELKDYFIEFQAYRDSCRFQSCVHVNEPNCAVKAALLDGEISKERYESYLSIYEELKSKKKYR
jgi:ribosome biogenesis GTPase / thiamine phosphate phosphatase